MQALLPLVAVIFIPHASIGTADADLVIQSCLRGSASSVVFSFTGAALLVTAFIERSLRDLSPYHSLIILNLTWMALVSSFCRAAVMCYIEQHGIPSFSMIHRLYESSNAQREERAVPMAVEYRRGEKRGDIALSRPSPALCRQFTALCFHQIIAGVLGWLLFRDVEGFAGPAGCPRDTVLWMFGSFVHITDAGPRLFWKAIYMTALLAPVSLPITCFLVCVILESTFESIFRLAATVSRILSSRRILPPRRPSALPLRAFEALCVALLVLLIVSTEKTIANNPVQGGEDEWGFGQILALLLVAFAVYESIGDFQMSRKLRRAVGGNSPVLPTSSPDTPL